MVEVLSQDEIDRLLSSISSGPISPDQKKRQYYNFNRPFMFTKNQRISLSDLHNIFTRGMGSVLSNLFDANSVFHVASVDELIYEEFIRAIPDPALLCIIELSLFPYSVVLEIDPVLVYSIVDLLAGGSGQWEKRNNKITDLKLMLMKEIIFDIIKVFREMWQTRIALNPVIKKIELKPGSVKIVTPETMILIITIESCIGIAEGMINICYPSNFIKAIYEIEKQKSEQNQNEYSQNNKEKIRFKKYNQFNIGNFSIQDILKFKGSTKMFIPKESKNIPKYIPVSYNEEEADV